MIITENDFYRPHKISNEDDALVSLGSEFKTFVSELEKDTSKRDSLDLGTDKTPSVAGRKFRLNILILVLVDQKYILVRDRLKLCMLALLWCSCGNLKSMTTPLF